MELDVARAQLHTAPLRTATASVAGRGPESQVIALARKSQTANSMEHGQPRTLPPFQRTCGLL